MAKIKQNGCWFPATHRSRISGMPALLGSGKSRPARSPERTGLLRIAFLAVMVIAPVQGQTASEVVLYNFSGANGAYPVAGVISDSSGNLYGTTYYGGTGGAGVVYKLDTARHETVLHSFTDGADGGYPQAGVIRDSSGNLYGTTYYGGTGNAGVVYKVNTAGQETVLYSFTGGADGGNPEAGVNRDSSGNLYGTTFYGGSANAGVVFKVDPSGEETVLYSFTGGAAGGNPPGGVISASSGNLYGTTPTGPTPAAV